MSYSVATSVLAGALAATSLFQANAQTMGLDSTLSIPIANGYSARIGLFADNPHYQSIQYEKKVATGDTLLLLTLLNNNKNDLLEAHEVVGASYMIFDSLGNSRVTTLNPTSSGVMHYILKPLPDGTLQERDKQTLTTPQAIITETKTISRLFFKGKRLSFL